jgi:hypothetical protein
LNFGETLAEIAVSEVVPGRVRHGVVVCQQESATLKLQRPTSREVSQLHMAPAAPSARFAQLSVNDWQGNAVEDRPHESRHEHPIVAADETGAC